MSASPPLRFLGLAIGGWICLRAVALLPGWWRENALPPSPSSPAPVAIEAPADARATRSTQTRSSSESAATTSIIRDLSYKTARWERPFAEPAPAVWSRPGGPLAAAPDIAVAPIRASLPPPSGTPGAYASAAASRRWSVSAWLLVRDERGAAALAPGGTLGGSQAGARLTYRLDDRLALSGRVYLPLRRMRGAEAAAGLDWQPLAAWPLHLLAERRQDLGGEGRSAFALTLYGGASRALPHGLRADLYGQAGMVGTRTRDLFADGALRVTARLGPVELGGGAWGGAQPGAARLDAGPSLSWRLPVEGAELRLQADWRFRIAGDAAPGSGPALTLSAGF